MDTCLDLAKVALKTRGQESKLSPDNWGEKGGWGVRVVVVLVIIALVAVVALVLAMHHTSGDANTTNTNGMGGMTVAIVQR